MFIKFVDIYWFFLCNSYPCVLFESLSHVINQESHVYSWNLGNLPHSFFQLFQKSELGKFIPNFPLKYVITSTKCKFVLCLLKEDGRNRSISIYNDVINFFNTSYLKYIVCTTVEIFISNRTELGARGKGGWKTFSW